MNCLRLLRNIDSKTFEMAARREEKELMPQCVDTFLHAKCLENAKTLEEFTGCKKMISEMRRVEQKCDRRLHELCSDGLAESAIQMSVKECARTYLKEGEQLVDTCLTKKTLHNFLVCLRRKN